MCLKQKGYIFESCFLLSLVMLLMCLRTTNAKPDNPPAFDEIFSRITKAERDVGYVGVCLKISNIPSQSYVREELVIHQPPDIHYVKILDSSENIGQLGLEAGKTQRKDKNRSGPSGDRIRSSSGRMKFISPKEMALLQRNYVLEYSPANEIAGQKADRLTIVPRFEGRPAKRLWIARDNGIILRVEDLDGTGNLRSLSMYTQISFQPEMIQQKLAEVQFEKKSRSRKKSRWRSERVSLPEAQKAFEGQLVLPTHLPQGFQLRKVTLMKQRCGSTVYLRYTDGLIEFSLFESKMSHSGKPRGSGDKKQINTDKIHGTPVQITAYQKTPILKWSKSNVDFTLIGGLSQSEMKKVAASLIEMSK